MLSDTSQHQHEPTSFNGRLVTIETTMDDAYHPGVLLKIASSSGGIVEVPIPAPTSRAPYENSWTELLEAVDYEVMHVIRGWDDTSGENENPVFDLAVEKMRQQLIGKRLAVSRVYHTPVYEISILEAPTGETADVNISTAVVRHEPQYVPLAEVVVESYARSMRRVPVLRYTLEDGRVFVQRMPYPAAGIESPEPDHWRPYEMVTGIHAERLAADWREDGGGIDQSQLAKLVAERVTSLLRHAPGIPLNEVGEPDPIQLGTVLLEATIKLGRRLRIYLGRPTHELHEASWRAIVAKYAERLFFMYDETGLHTVYINGDTGKDMMTTFDTRDAIGSYLIRAADFALYKAGKPDMCVSPPADLLGFMIANPAPSVVRGIRTLDRFTRTPFITRSGRVHQTHGYDYESRTWLALHPDDKFREVSDVPSAAEVRLAKNILLEPMMEYPFSDADGGNSAAYAAILTPFAMSMLPGALRPFFLIDAPPGGQGSGKTKLAQMIAVYADGNAEPPVSPMPKSDEKLNEFITSTLRNSRTVAIIDNIQSSMRSEDLATAATSLTWSTRRFNHQTLMDLPNRVTWIFTANHASISPDIARRAVNVMIDVTKIGDGTPAYKRFFRWEPVTEAARRRNSAVWAALTLLRNWVVKGRPVDAKLKMGSFEAWARCVGGALYAAGIGGLDRAIESARARDEVNAEHEAFVKRWLEMYGGAIVTTPTLATLCVASGFYPAVFDRATRGSTWSYRRLVDQVLTPLVDRRVGHVYIAAATRSATGGRRWKLLDDQRRPIPPRGANHEEEVSLVEESS